MQLVFITQYYPPETGAAQNRIANLTARLARAGHTVTVITAMPNYPRGQIFSEYQGSWFRDEEIGAVRVIRTWIYATRRTGLIPRLLTYFSFVVTCVFGALFKIKSPDLVVVETPPLFLGLSGLFLSWFWRAKHVFNVSDLWPQSAVDLGIVRSKRIISLSTKLEEFIYKHSDLITGQTQGIVSNIADRVKTPVWLLTNGVENIPCSMVDRGDVRRRLGFSQESFLVGYAGLHGLAQALDSVLAAAEKLSKWDGISFVFFGDGPTKADLEEFARRRQLANVFFFPPQPKIKMDEIMQCLDVSIVPLKRLDLFKGAIPSKLLESMATGIPVILAIDGEAKQIVKVSGGGICVTPEDPDELAEAVQFLAGRRDLCRSMGSKGRDFVTANYDLDTIAKRAEDTFARLLPNQTVQEPTQIVAHKN